MSLGITACHRADATGTGMKPPSRPMPILVTMLLKNHAPTTMRSTAIHFSGARVVVLESVIRSSNGVFTAMQRSGVSLPTARSRWVAHRDASARLRELIDVHFAAFVERSADAFCKMRRRIITRDDAIHRGPPRALSDTDGAPFRHLSDELGTRAGCKHPTLRVREPSTIYLLNLRPGVSEGFQ